MSDSRDDVDLAAWADLATDDDPEARLAERAWVEYVNCWPDAELVTFPFGEASFWFDTFSQPDGRESRTVAAWTRIPAGVSPREASRQRRHPLAPALA
jgi:hypothetical protein